MEPNYERNRAEFNKDDVALGFPNELPLTPESLNTLRNIAADHRERAVQEMADHDTHPSAMQRQRELTKEDQARLRVVSSFQAAISSMFCRDLDKHDWSNNEGPGLGQE